MFKEYFNELDPVKRRAALDALAQDSVDEDEWEQINKLFEARYTKDKKRGYVDHFLGTILDLQVLASNKNGPFVKKQNEKLVYTALDVLCLNQPTEFSRDILYQEMCHLTKAYIAVCQQDKNYNAILWGMGKINNDVQTLRIRQDLDKIAEVVTRYPDIAEEYAILRQALYDIKADLCYEG